MNILAWRRDEEAGQEEDEEKDNEEADEEEDENKEPPSRTQIAVKAVLLLVFGTAGCAVFSDPLVDAVSNFSKVLPSHPDFLDRSFVLQSTTLSI